MQVQSSKDQRQRGDPRVRVLLLGKRGKKHQINLHQILRGRGKMTGYVLYVWKKKSGKNFVRVGCIWSG